MTITLSNNRTARILGIGLGIALAAAALLSWRVPGGEHTLGADVRFEALQTGPVGVAPIQPFASSPSLLPGSAVSGDVSLRNQTGTPLALRLRALPSTSDLNSLLRVRVSAGARSLYDGSLGGLRSAGTSPLRLAPGRSAAVHVTAALPASVRSGFEGRIVDVSLQVGSSRAR
jgi:hypothetical protein